MKNNILLLVALLFSTWAFSFENDLTSVCKRPGSNELFVGGEFKTLFVVDAISGKTIRQLKLEDKVLDLQFSEDGQHLLVSSGDKLYYLNPETGTASKTIKGRDFRLFEHSPYFLDVDWIFNKSVKVYGSNEGDLKFEHQPDFTPLDASIDPTFSELIILGRGAEIKKEKTLITNQVEKIDGFNIYNKAYVDQQKDGQGSGFKVIDIESQAAKMDVMIPYTTSTSFGLSISKLGDDYFISCWDMLLRIDSEGKSHPISYSDPHFAYATNSTNDGKHIITASTKDGYIYNCEDGKFTPFDTKDGSEFAYSCDISDTEEGIYLLAKDYSVVRIDHTGKVLGKFKIDNSTGSGFGAYYYNGFTKEESRNKEASIINKVLQELEMEKIDLETGIGQSDFLLGTFDTQEDAKAFVEKLKSNGLQYLVKVAPVE